MVFVQKFMMRKKSDTGARADTQSASQHCPHMSYLSSDAFARAVCADIFTPELNKKCQEIIKML